MSTDVTEEEKQATRRTLRTILLIVIATSVLISIVDGIIFGRPPTLYALAPLSPMKIAHKMAERLKTELPPYIIEIGVSPPGYLNFKVDWPELARDLIPKIFQEGEQFGKPVSPLNHKVFIEHTSVNPNKAMHIGHLRNSVLGDTVARALKWNGFSTEVCNYIDDTGLQVVDVVTAILYLDFPPYADGISDFRFIWAKIPENQPLYYFCWDLYARFQIELEKSPSLLEKREEVLHQIEGGLHPIAGFAKELATRIAPPADSPCRCAGCCYAG